MTARRHWSINGRFLSQPLTGVQRYALEITRALDHAISVGHPLTKDLTIDIIVPKQTNQLSELTAIEARSAGVIGGHLWEQTVLPRHIHGGLLSLGNTGPILTGKQIVCIHDLNVRTYPASYSLPFRSAYRVLLPAIGKSATMIATVSAYSADDLVRYGICSHDKIVLAPNGHEHSLRWHPQHSQATLKAAGRNTVVLVGSLAPHKNMALITGLAGKLRDAGLRIAVVGIADAHVFNAQMPISHVDNISWLGRLPDGELAALLRDSLCLAFPSFVEGFGLPVLEAMSTGCPVVASDRASLPEVCDDAVLYAPPTDTEAWFDRLVQLHRDEPLRQTLIAKGRKRALRFSWKKSAEVYLRAMAAVDGVMGERFERANRSELASALSMD